jgi:very-short-patch-repair endonuclease
MGWRDWKVAVEFDGAQHWTDPAQRARDIDRIAEVQAFGWQIVRVSSDLLRYRPHTVVQRAPR